MRNDLNILLDKMLSNVLELFKDHPEMQQLLRSMAIAICTDLKGIEPDNKLFPKLLADNGIKVFETNFKAFMTQVQSLDAEFKPACTTGCSYCCSPHITVMPQEAFNIGLHLATSCSIDLFTELAEQCFAMTTSLGDNPVEKFVESYFYPCPFLVDDQCSIYEVRPLLCRNWISTDVEACKQSYAFKNKTTIPQNSLIISQKDLVYAGQAAYLMGFGINGQICSFLPLMGQVLTDFEGTYSKWLSREKLKGQFS